MLDEATHHCGTWIYLVLPMGTLGDSAECPLGEADLRKADVFMRSSLFFIGGGLLQATLPPALLACPVQGRKDPPAVHSELSAVCGGE